MAVCHKRWKLRLESVYFDQLYLSSHCNPAYQPLLQSYLDLCNGLFITKSFNNLHSFI